MRAHTLRSAVLIAFVLVAALVSVQAVSAYAPSYAGSAYGIPTYGYEPMSYGAPAVFGVASPYSSRTYYEADRSGSTYRYDAYYPDGVVSHARSVRIPYGSDGWSCYGSGCSKARYVNSYRQPTPSNCNRW